MAPAQAATLVAELAEALELVHQRGLVHGNIAPALILLDGERHLHLGGFDEGPPVTSGTPAQQPSAVTAYTAPERIGPNIRPVDPRTDVYGLGALLYYLITGQPPFRAGGGQDLATLILQGPPAPPRALDRPAATGLESIYLKAMATDPAARYATAGELAVALRDFLKPQRKAFWK
jgi:serine/threonine protein kinase